MRILMSAYSALPGQGSEPGVGFQWARAAATLGELTVMTRERNVRALQSELPDGVRVYGLDFGRKGLLAKRVLGAKVYYIAWQVLAVRHIRRLHKEDPFDVCHHVTFASDWLPAGALARTGALRVWGPVGGSTPLVSALLRPKWLGWRGVCSEVFRLVSLRLLRKFVGQRSFSRADVVLFQNEAVASLYPEDAKVRVHPNVVVPSVREPTAGEGNLLVLVARLLPWKGVSIALDALRRTESNDWVLEVVGSGPDRARLERQARRWGLEERVIWRGTLEHSETLVRIGAARALISASIHEAAGFAVAEAVGSGTPVIYIDFAGPSHLVPSNAGKGVPPEGDIACGIARAIDDLDRLTSDRQRENLWTPERLPQILSEAYAGVAKSTFGDSSNCSV